MTISDEVRQIVEDNPVALATVMADGNPNVIGVACVRVISSRRLLITDVYMYQTLEDIKLNPNLAIAAWNKDLMGYKLIGKATYYAAGKYLDQVKQMPENKDLKPKGAIVVEVKRIIKSA